MDQLTPHWDAVNKVASITGTQIGSVEIFKAAPPTSIEVFAENQATGATAVIPLGTAPRAGTIIAASVAAITPLTGNDTYTLDIYKNGVTILSAPMALLSGTAARAAIAGTLAVTKVLAGDFFEAVATYTHGSGTAPLNVEFQVTLSEDNGAASTVPLGIATRAGFVKDCRVAAITPLTGNATFTVDIKQNGTTILSAVMALLSGTAARASIVGALAVANTPVAVGDFFEAVFTSTAGTGTPPFSVLAQMQLSLN